MIYLDNGSTTPIAPRVKGKIVEFLDGNFGNPSSLHQLGVNAEKQIKEDRLKVAKLLKISEKNIVFTSGGSESNNYAIKACASTFSQRGKHIISTKIEHASVYNTLKEMEKEGYEVDFLSVDQYGQIDLEELKSKVRKDTILVSIMHVNNEMGAIQDLESIGNAIKSINERTIFHTDAVASFGKIPIDLDKCKIDLLSASGHKVYTPKGIGILYIKKGLNLKSLISGGAHEDGRRAGTENTLGIHALGEACLMLSEMNLSEEIKKFNELKKHLIKNLENKLMDFKINSFVENKEHLFSPYILNVSFKGVKGEVLLHYLESKDIYVSTTSACSSKGTKKENRILEAISVPKDYIDGSIRISLSHFTTVEELDEFVKVLKEALEMLRMFKK